MDSGLDEQMNEQGLLFTSAEGAHLALIYRQLHDPIAGVVEHVCRSCSSDLSIL